MNQWVQQSALWLGFMLLWRCWMCKQYQCIVAVQHAVHLQCTALLSATHACCFAWESEPLAWLVNPVALRFFYARLFCPLQPALFCFCGLLCASNGADTSGFVLWTAQQKRMPHADMPLTDLSVSSTCVCTRCVQRAALCGSSCSLHPAATTTALYC